MFLRIYLEYNLEFNETKSFRLLNSNLNPTYYNFSKNSKEMKRLSVQRVQRSGHDSEISCRIQ
jgi:hypothetical protein